MKQIFHEKLQETMYTETLPNGLTVYYYPKSNYNKTYVMMSVNYGNVNQTYQTEVQKTTPAGVAHFLEHKLFELEDGSDAFYHLSNLGANANAFTSNSMTSYLFSCTNNLYKSLEIFFEFVCQSHFKKESVENEKGIILQELAMEENKPTSELFFQLFQAMYHNHPVRTRILGEKEDILAINHEILTETYRTFYQPHNMVLAICGKVDPIEMSQFLYQTFPNENQIVEIQPLFPEEPKEVKDSFVLTKVNTETNYVFFGIKLPVEEGKLPYQHLKYTAITHNLFSQTSKICQELLDEGLIFDSLGTYLEVEDSYRFIMVNAVTSNYQALVEKLKGYSKVFHQYLSKDLFHKFMKTEYADHVLSWDSLEEIANIITAHHFSHSTILDDYQNLQTLTFEELEQEVKLWNEKQYTMVVGLPKK